MTDVQIQSIDKVSIGNIPIRNGGVYVISGIFSGANACVCGKKCIPVPVAGRRSTQSGAKTSNREISPANCRFAGEPKEAHFA